MTTTTEKIRTSTPPRAGLVDSATYLTSFHLMADLVIGTATFSVMVSLLALSAGLMITLVGVPLLVATLFVARGIGTLERRRARGVIGLDVVAPSHGGRRLRDRLLDPADWRAVLYAILLFPAGLVTGTVTLVGWSVAVAAVASPIYVGRFDDSTPHLDGINLEGPVATTATVLVGIALLLMMPTVVRTLARVDAFLVRRLLAA
jgi:hypothetical protein